MSQIQVFKKNGTSDYLIIALLPAFFDVLVFMNYRYIVNDALSGTEEPQLQPTYSFADVEISLDSPLSNPDLTNRAAALIENMDLDAMTEYVFKSELKRLLALSTEAK